MTEGISGSIANIQDYAQKMAELAALQEKESPTTEEQARIAELNTELTTVFESLSFDEAVLLASLVYAQVKNDEIKDYIDDITKRNETIQQANTYLAELTAMQKDGGTPSVEMIQWFAEQGVTLTGGKLTKESIMANMELVRGLVTKLNSDQQVAMTNMNDLMRQQDLGFQTATKLIDAIKDAGNTCARNMS
ncbi:MAG: hypothetical protein H0S85_03025 [Desulfovibrionaceae bacterium]|jgi:hypothetical protein|nr:hypothetical protein [Desulfovibrionaceae bacterium]